MMRLRRVAGGAGGVKWSPIFAARKCPIFDERLHSFKFDNVSYVKLYWFLT
jgi:hypothetical protein